MPVDHYENFPVASLLVPAKLRQPIEVIYRFARSADDIADEGDATPEERLAGLAAYQAELDRIAAGITPATPLFVALSEVITAYALPIQLFRDLLDAFAQDVVKKRYADYPGTARLLPALGQPGRAPGAAPVRPYRRRAV